MKQKMEGNTKLPQFFQREQRPDYVLPCLVIDKHLETLLESDQSGILEMVHFLDIRKLLES